MSRAAGTVVVFNNSDCIPQDEHWLERLLAPLRASSDVAAVFGRQIPRPDARPLVVKDYERAFGSGRTAASWGHFFSLATSAAPRALLLRHPFNDDLRYSEDVEWSYRMKKLGLRIVYVQDAVVEHSHNYNLRELRRRFYGEGVSEAFIYGNRPGWFRGFLLPFGAELVRDAAFLIARGKLLSLPWAPIYRAVQKHSAYRGRRERPS